MKITSEITIDQPRSRVVELITNPDNTPKWQSGIQSIELLSGAKDQVGARSRVVVELNGFRLELIETVVQRRPPDLYASAFEARGVKNTVVNRFYEAGPEQTRWVMENTFQFGVLMAVVGVFIRDLIAKQTVELMRRFKSFAEKDRIDPA